MKRILCLLLTIALMCSSSIDLFAAESEKYVAIPVEYSDNVGNSEQLDLMVKNKNVYVNAEMIANRLGYQCGSDDDHITIYNREDNDLPIAFTQFFYNNTKVNHTVFMQMLDTYEAPFPSVRNDRGSWIPLEYSLLILNSGLLILDDSMLIDIPCKNIVDSYYDIMKKHTIYNFDWNKDFGYTEADWKVIGASSHISNLFNGILDFDGDSWGAMFQSFLLDSSSYDKKYGEDLALLLCGESEAEVNESIKKMELYQGILSEDGKLGEILTTYSANLDAEVGMLYENCEEILENIKEGNSSVAIYNRTYRALEDAFDKQTWFSNTGGNIIKAQKGISDLTSFLDVGLKVAEVVGYRNEFENQDEFCLSALNHYLDNSTSSAILSDEMKRSMKDYSDTLSSNMAEYSATRFFNENIDNWIVDALPINDVIGTQASIALFAWNIASNVVPFISNGLDATDKFELALYSQIFQADAYLNYLNLRNTILSSARTLSSEELYNLSRYCFIYLKSCYITRNAALSTLNGKRDSVKEQIQPLIDYQDSINKDIAKTMILLKTANKTNEGNVYGFLPSENEGYLNRYDDNELIKWIENLGNKSSVFESMPKGFDFSSGAGAWGTHIDIENDGSFVGQYHDTEMGDAGEDNPNGTVFICNFSGKFSNPEQIGEYTYSMKLEWLETDGNLGDTYIEDGIMYINSEPYGFDDADEFIIYVPGIQISDLPEGFVLWLYGFMNVETTKVLPYYGIYNVNGEEGFIGYE